MILLNLNLDKFPIKRVLTVGAIIFGVGFILLSFTQSFFQFLLVYGLVIAMGMVIFGNLSTSKLIANWFNDKISRVIDGSKEISESYFNEHKNSIKKDILFINNELSSEEVFFLLIEKDSQNF